MSIRHSPDYRSPNERAESHPASRPRHSENDHEPHPTNRDVDPCAPLPTDSLEPLQAFFSLFRSRWSLVVLAALAPEEMGCDCAMSFAQTIEHATPHTLRRHKLEKRLPHITPKVLTQTLRRLEGAGLVECHRYAEVPTRVEYSITAQGQLFLQPLRNLQGWCEQNQNLMQEALCLLPGEKNTVNHKRPSRFINSEIPHSG